MRHILLTLLDQGRLASHYAQGFWRRDTLFTIAQQHARRMPDKIAVRDRARTITYAGLVFAAEQLAKTLDDQGVRGGQRVAVWLPSRIETAVALLACSRNGYVCCPSLHKDHSAEEVGSLLVRMRAAALIAETGYGDRSGVGDIFETAEGLDAMRHIERLAPLKAEGEPRRLLPERPAGPFVETVPPNDDPDRVSYLAFTSGTTGQPKGVMHSDNTVLSNARALAADWHLDESAVIYTLSPLSHNLGFGAMITALLVGGELVVHDLPRNASLLDRIMATGTTFLFGVPTHAIDLLSDLRRRGLSGLGAVKGFRISGAPVPREVAAELIRFGVTPQSGYGMTEGCSHHYTLPADDPRLIIETSGRACPGYEIRIWAQDDPDRELPTGEVGQIGGRGASLMLGYFDDQAATEDSFNRDGWFMTGDLGWVDSAGYLRITGRKKDLIIRGGHNIYPARIEALAMAHSAVQRAVALPIPDARLGEKVCLAVMTLAGSSVTAEAMLEHLNAAGLSRSDMPEYFLTLDDIPLTASGKVLKRAIVSSVEEGRFVPVPIRWQPKAIS